MSYWLREIAGWALVALGLVGMYVCWLYLKEGMPIQAGPLTIIAIILFRGGIHLLKVAVAARICLQARDRMKRDRPGVARPAVTAANRGS